MTRHQSEPEMLFAAQVADSAVLSPLVAEHRFHPTRQHMTLEVCRLLGNHLVLDPIVMSPSLASRKHPLEFGVLATEVGTIAATVRSTQDQLRLPFVNDSTGARVRLIEGTTGIISPAIIPLNSGERLSSDEITTLIHLLRKLGTEKWPTLAE